MNRVYQLCLEQIQQYKLQHQNTSIVIEVIQVLNSDLSCQLYFSTTNLHQSF